VASSLLNPLRPKPFRGDVIAAGVVVLATLVWVVRARFGGVWGPGGHLAWAGVPWAFVTLLAVLAPMERDEPRAYQSVLYVSSVALGIAVVVSLGEVLGAARAFSTVATTTWMFAAVAALSLAFAIGRNSAVCTLLGAVSGGVAVIALFSWIFSPDRLAPYRWIVLALVLAYTLAAVAQRDRRLRHGVALIDAAGMAVLAIGLSFVPFLGLFFVLFAPDVDGTTAADNSLSSMWVDAARVGWGWELLILAASFGLIAYSSIDRQPGPAYFGVANLIVFVVIGTAVVAHSGATLVGWPIALALVAAILLAIGLRPSTPAPPPPDIDAPEPPPLPLR
jgi:hypothetical protein